MYGDENDDEEPRGGASAADTGANQSSGALFGITPQNDTRVQAQPDDRTETPEYAPSGSGMGPENAPAADGPSATWGVGEPKPTPGNVAGHATSPMPSSPFATSAYDPSGAPMAQTATPAAGAAAGAGALPWVAPIASALAGRMQENQARQQAKAGMQGEYASQFGFPMYGLEGKMQGRNITNRFGGLGLGNLFRRH